jgi:hypothetical protein
MVFNGIKRQSFVFLAALIMGAVLVIPPAPTASAASNGLWSVSPTTLPGQAPRELFNPVLTPGKAYSDSVTVANYTRAALTFNLYGSDAFNTPGGGLSLRRRTDTQVDLGRWITLPYRQLSVPARSYSIVPFTILAPSQAAPGDYVGGIVAEETQGTTSHAGSVPITVLQAVGVRIYARVVGPLHPELTIGGTSLAVRHTVASQFGGPVGATVKFTVTNSGNTVLNPIAAVLLTTPVGTAGRRTVTINQLLPGNSLKCSLNFPSVSAYGHLRAAVTVTGLRAKATSSVSAWAVPWVLLVIILVVLFVLVALFVRFRRHRHGVPEPTDPEMPPS